MTHLDELLSAAKSLDETPPPEAGARMWAKVAARVGGGAAIGVAVATAGVKSASAATTAAASTAATTAGATVTSSLGLTLAKVGAALALTAGIGVGVAKVATDPAPETTAPTVEAVVAERAEAPRRRAETAAPQGIVEVPIQAEEPEEVIEITEEPPAPKTKARARKRPEPQPEPQPAPASALAAESDLLGKAKVAASSGRNQDALGAIRQHAQKYPNGELAEVRRALEVKVLCKLGRTDAARTAADRFLKRHGASALAGQVRQSCAYDE